jgi:superfamily I DNA/RNA helicase/RecB family exonuclease
MQYRLVFGEQHLPALDAGQEAVLQGWSGPLLVLGGPGTGKTTLVAHAALREIRAGGRPVVFARTRQAASELRNAITAGLGGQVWQPAVTTAHAFCRTVLERFSDEFPRLLDAPAQEYRVRELLAGNPDLWPADLRRAVGTAEFARQVRGALARARQLGLDPADVRRIAVGSELWRSFADFFAEYLDVLDAEEVIDYAELVHRARIKLSMPEVAERLRSEISAVLIDDYPELDPAQIGAVAALAPAKLLAVGDPHTVISAFRGSHPRAVRDFAEIFATVGPARVTELVAGFRQPKVLADALAGVRARLPQLGSAKLAPALAAGIGHLQALSCPDAAGLAKCVVELVREARLGQGIGYADQAVVGNSARVLPPILRALQSAGVPVQQPPAAVPLPEAEPVRVLLQALRFVAGEELDAATSRFLLTSPLIDLDAVELSEVLRVRAESSPAATSESQLLVAALRPDAQPARFPPGLQRFWELAGLAAEAVAVDRAAWIFWEQSGWAARVIGEAQSGGARAAAARRELELVREFFVFAGGLPDAGIPQLLAEITGQQIPADMAREARSSGAGVELLTVHQAKGRQWRSVIVVGAEEGSWPTVSGASKLLDPACLLSDALGEADGPAAAMAAQRRSFYTACATASERLTVLAVAQSAGEAVVPSRFIAELGADAGSLPRVEMPLELSGLIAALRANADADGAAAVLAAIANEGVAAADPQRWWGVLELSGADPGLTRYRLSPSQLGSLLECPRRHFLSQQVKGDPPTNHQAALGTVVHRGVELMSAGELGPEVTAWLDAEFKALPTDVPWQVKALRDKAERALLAFWHWQAARPTELLATEARFEFTRQIEGVELLISGSIDRLELAASGLQVVDFKTSPSAWSRRKVESLEQLGVYQVAVEEGAFPQGSHSALAMAVFLADTDARGMPKVREQAAVAGCHLDPDDAAYPNWVEQRLAKAARIIAAGEFPAIRNPGCRSCPFTDCPAWIPQEVA